MRHARILILKLVLLSFSIILLESKIFAQNYHYVPFPDSNAVWSEMHWKSINESGQRWVYYKNILSNEDTLVGSITYNKLFYCNKNEITKENSVCVALLREDSLRKVWIRHNTTGIWPNTNANGEYLLYDFSLSEGDTINCYESFLLCQGLSELILDSVRFININNQLRKIYYFNRPWEIWIEGIGKIKGLIYPSGDLKTNEEDNDLICFHLNDTLLFFNSGQDDIYDDCLPSFVMSDALLVVSPYIKVYPNPVVGEQVYFENLDFETLELFDVKGCLLNTIDIEGKVNYTLEVANYSKGIYFYQLQTKGLIPTRGKLIIE